MFRTEIANPILAAILADRHKDIGSHLLVVTSAVKLSAATCKTWTAVKRIPRYLEDVVNYGLRLSNGQYRCLTSYIIKFGFRLVSWSPQRHQTTALSTAAVEYIAACQTTKEVMWFRRLLSEHLSLTEILETLYMGNESTIKLIKHSLCHRRIKHMEILYQYMRQAYEKGIFKLQYIPSNNLDSYRAYLPNTWRTWSFKNVEIYFNI